MGASGPCCPPLESNASAPSSPVKTSIPPPSPMPASVRALRIAVSAAPESTTAMSRPRALPRNSATSDRDALDERPDLTDQSVERLQVVRRGLLRDHRSEAELDVRGQ